MEEKYPKATNGFKLIFFGVLISVPVMLLTNIVLLLEYNIFETTFSAIAIYTMLQVSVVMTAIGLRFIKAEMKGFQKAFYCSLPEVLLAVLYFVLLLSGGGKAAVVMQALSYVAAVIRLGFFCSQLEEVLPGEGKKPLFVLTKTAFAGQLLFYLELLLLALLPDVRSGTFFKVYLFAGAIGMVTGGISYLLLLWKVFRIFGQQKQTESPEQEAEQPGTESARKKGFFAGMLLLAAVLLIAGLGIFYQDTLVQLYAKGTFSDIEAFSKELLKGGETGKSVSYGPWEATCYPNSDIVVFCVRSSETETERWECGFYYSAYNKHKEIQRDGVYRLETIETTNDTAVWTDPWKDSMGVSERICWRLFWYEIKVEKE